MLIHDGVNTVADKTTARSRAVVSQWLKIADNLQQLRGRETEEWLQRCGLLVDPPIGQLHAQRPPPFVFCVVLVGGVGLAAMKASKPWYFGALAGSCVTY